MPDSNEVKTPGSEPPTPTQASSSVSQSQSNAPTAEQRIARRSIASEVWSMGKKFQGAAFSQYFGSAAGPVVPAAPPAVVEQRKEDLSILDKAKDKAQEKSEALHTWVRETRDSLVRKLMFNPLFFIGDFINILASIVMFPFIFCFLYASMTISNYVEGFLGRYRKDSESGSLINLVSYPVWADPTLLSSGEALKTVNSARATLSGLPTTLPEAPALVTSVGGEGEFRTTRIFDLDVAKSLLLMSTLVYEIRDADVKAAKSAEQIKEVESCLKRSEGIIREQASKWGLRYLSMSGFKSDSKLGKKTGPFASCFYTPPDTEEPFIVLCFKGTTPDNFDEFIVDASISRVSCASFFGDGTAHRGFMRELFSVDRNSSDDFGQMTMALRLLASELAAKAKEATKAEHVKPVPLWITGHSLGAALASLAYARYLRYPRDLGRGIVLRDAYTFGCPRVGDGAFASRFEASASNPIDRPNMLWRVRNNSDIITRIPLGLADNELNRPGLSVLSMLNYSHIGTEVKLCPDEEPFYKVDTTSLHSATRVLVVKAEQQGAARTPSWFPFFSGWGKEWLKPGKWASWFFVRAVETATPIWNHFPASYYAHLSKMNVDGQGGAARSLATQPSADKKG